MTAAVSAAETQLPSPLPTSLPFTGSHCQQGTCHFCFRRGNGANTVLQLAEALPWPLLCLNLSPSLLLPAVPSVPQVAKQRSYLHSSGRKQSTERNAICPKSWWESMTMWATEALPLSRIRLQLSDCISLHPLNPLVAFPHQAMKLAFHSNSVKQYFLPLFLLNCEFSCAHALKHAGSPVWTQAMLRALCACTAPTYRGDVVSTEEPKAPSPHLSPWGMLWCQHHWGSPAHCR